jgi:hypothetical protein
MNVKILEPAVGRRGSTIVAVDGHLRVVDDPTPICFGYANGCRCEPCKERAQLHDKRDRTLFVLAQSCECHSPQSLGDAGSGCCSKCGKPVALPQAA